MTTKQKVEYGKQFSKAERKSYQKGKKYGFVQGIKKTKTQKTKAILGLKVNVNGETRIFPIKTATTRSKNSYGYPTEKD